MLAEMYDQYDLLFGPLYDLVAILCSDFLGQCSDQSACVHFDITYYINVA